MVASVPLDLLDGQGLLALEDEDELSRDVRSLDEEERGQ